MKKAVRLFTPGCDAAGAGIIFSAAISSPGSDIKTWLTFSADQAFANCLWTTSPALGLLDPSEDLLCTGPTGRVTGRPGFDQSAQRFRRYSLSILLAPKLNYSAIYFRVKDDGEAIAIHEFV
jgi:hypothetical protein